MFELCRLGYEQDNVLDAIREVFIKVLQLDPHKDVVMVNFQRADAKLKDELAQIKEEIDNLMGNRVTHPATGPEEGGNDPCEVAEEVRESSGDDRKPYSVVDCIEMHMRTE
ncbi:hypothetical protein SESBI_08352 [Sesbania bispinosa]|nr:hypothetical protein SESBI_08352 [Sesbania bispinosa]